MLAWLWDTVVAPVAEAVSTDRVWWLPVGLLGLLPLHAAGYPDRAGALDRFVSSYLPTLRALDADRPAAVPRRQMVVSLPQTPGLAELPGTAAEAADLRRARPERPLLTGPGATVAAVMAALPNSTWVHFAGHAEAEVAGSGEAGLHLRDGLLTVSRIAALNLRDAELAYLSACSTGHRGVFSDEPLALATAFHMAGFRHVIASLWPLDDEIAAVASRAFYRACDSADDAAAALHRAAVEMRAARPDRPDRWAALIHSGR